MCLAWASKQLSRYIIDGIRVSMSSPSKTGSPKRAAAFLFLLTDGCCLYIVRTIAAIVRTP